MAALDYLFEGTPAAISANTTSTSTLPDWYQEYMRGIAGKGTELAGLGYQPYEGQRLADFNPTQQQAFGQVQANQGNWQPNMQAATGAAGQIMPATQQGLQQGAQYGQAAVGAVAGDPASFTDKYQQYMSPYTTSVVNEISRLGNQNLQENIMPSINNSFIGSGQFGSTRNAQVLGQGIRDAQTNISGLQSQALQAGYTDAGQLYNQDANRLQQQQGMQSNANVQAGQLANAGAQIGGAAADQAAGRYSALGQLQQTLGSNDAAALGAVGGQQQALEQAGYDTSYNEFNNQKNYEWSNLNNLNSVLRGMQLPTGQTTTGTQTNTAGSPSPLGWVNSLYGLNQAGAVAKP